MPLVLGRCLPISPLGGATVDGGAGGGGGGGPVEVEGPADMLPPPPGLAKGNECFGFCIIRPPDPATATGNWLEAIGSLGSTHFCRRDHYFHQKSLQCQ